MAGVPIRPATAAHAGIADLPTLLGYSTAAALTWPGYTWPPGIRAASCRLRSMSVRAATQILRRTRIAITTETARGSRTSLLYA